jgi:hypothetical protein
MESFVMKTVLRLAVGACAVGMLVVASGTGAEAARCNRVAVKGEGITPEIAREMAKMNLEFAVMEKNAKAAGPVAYKCGTSGPFMLNSCTARQRACT